MRKLILIILCCLATFTGCCDKKISPTYKASISQDGETIAYTVYGQEEKALIFIHGWSCDSRYWQKQISTFAKDYKVITIDLAGHGNSSANRQNYSVLSFAYDVKSVITQEKIKTAILIGHSMGGIIISEAARLMPKEISGLIAIDTLQNVEHEMTQAAFEQMVSPFEKDFKAAAQNFVGSMFPKDADPDLINWVKEDMSSAPSAVALSAFKDYLGRYLDGSIAPVFKDINVPLYSINARLWPTYPEANRKYIKDYTLVYIENTGHFPMLEKPKEFNNLLKEAILHLGLKSLNVKK